MIAGVLSDKGSARIHAPCNCGCGKCGYVAVAPGFPMVVIPTTVQLAEKAIMESFERLKAAKVPCVLVEVDR